MACRWSDAPTKSANFAHVRRQEGPYFLPPRGEGALHRQGSKEGRVPSGTFDCAERTAAACVGQR